MTNENLRVYDGEILKPQAKFFPTSVLEEVPLSPEPLSKPMEIPLLGKTECQLAGIQYVENYGRFMNHDELSDEWIPAAPKPSYRQITSIVGNEPDTELIGDAFLEKVTGVYLVDPESPKKTLLMNFKIRPQKLIRKIGIDRKESRYLEIKLICNNIHEVFDIPESSYKKLNTIVPEKYPFCCIEPGINQAHAQVKKYLTYVYAQCASELEEAVKYEHTGWTEIIGKPVYLHGGLDCCTSSKIIPDYPKGKLAEIFENGFKFLSVGANYDVILVPFLYAHVGFLAKLFSDAKYPSEFVLFIKGKTGSFKTSMASELFNIFETNKEMKKFNFDTTQTAMEMGRDAAIDDILFLDDLNFSLKSQKKAMNEKFETTIRAFGDSNSKARAAHDMKSQLKFKVRGGCVVTAEDEPDVSQSTTLRYISIEVGKGSYNSEQLLKFRNDPSIMWFYFAAFIKFIEQHYPQIVQYIKQNFEIIHAKYSNKFQFARLAFSAVILKIVADIMLLFGSYYCQAMPEEKAQQYLSEFENVITKVLLTNEDNSRILEPHEMYLYGLVQCLGNQEFHAANDIDVYINNMSEYIGFYTDNELWLKHEETYARIVKYFDKQGKSLTATMSKIHIALYAQGISRGYESNGKQYYLCKGSAKISGRPNMLVLKVDKLKELVTSFH